MAFTQRTAMLIGQEGVQTLAGRRVAVFGVGGVGGFAAEALARAGVGGLSLFDGDCVAESNLNRQIIALGSTLGQNKAEVMKRRILDINPACAALALPVFYTPQNAAQYPFADFDYIVDAVDMVSAKLEIIQRAKEAGVPVITSMGAGNKLHPELFELSTVENTSVCPLARVMRRELKKRGITGVSCVYSREEPQRPENGGEERRAPGSISFVPGTAGLILAGAVVRDLLKLRAN